MQLRMAPLIDVVFLLLVFFLLVANFRSREGFLPAELPRQVVHTEVMEMEPLQLFLNSLADGSCEVQIGAATTFVVKAAREEGDFTQLGRELKQVLAEQGRSFDDPVKLIPTRQTRWDHVVKAYDALWQINLRHIIFALVD